MADHKVTFVTPPECGRARPALRRQPSSIQQGLPPTGEHHSILTPCWIDENTARRRDNQLLQRTAASSPRSSGQYRTCNIAQLDEDVAVSGTCCLGMTEPSREYFNLVMINNPLIAARNTAGAAADSWSGGARRSPADRLLALQTGNAGRPAATAHPSTATSSRCAGDDVAVGPGTVPARRSQCNCPRRTEGPLQRNEGRDLCCRANTGSSCAAAHRWSLIAVGQILAGCCR